MFTLLAGEKTWGDTIAVYNYLIRGHSDDGAQVLSEVSGRRVRGNGCKLAQGGMVVN